MRFPSLPILVLALILSLATGPATAADECSVALKACEAACWANHPDATGTRAKCIAGCSAESVACSSKKGYEAGKEAVSGGYEATKEAVGKGVDATKDAYQSTKEFIQRQLEDDETKKAE